MLDVVIIGFFSFTVLFYCGYSLFALVYGKNVKYKRGTDYTPEVTLVVPTRNEEKTIQQKIDNILETEYPKDMIEVIFVDSSNDGTKEIINSFKKNSSMKVALIEEKECRGLASALNIGYAAANGDIIIKSDCDMQLDKDFVKNIVTYFSDPQVGAVTGAIEVANKSDIEKGYRTLFHKLRLAEANFDSTYVFNAFAFRRTLLERINEKSVADDAELALKIRKRGYKTLFAPDAIIYESSPLSIKDRIEQKSRRAQGHILLACQNLSVLFNPKYGRFGIVIFPANFLMMLVLPWLMLSEIVLICIWLLTLLGYAALPVILVIILGISFVYLKSKPRLLAGFIDSQINLIVGTLQLIRKGPKFSWKD